MMNLSKNLYVFMLALLIVVSGCLGSGTTEGDEEVVPTVNNYYNNTTVDEPEWFSQGGIADVQWNTDTTAAQSINDPRTWNTTECDAIGTFDEYGSFGVYPSCDIYLTSISTQSGQMLVIHEWTAFYLNTTCDGETITTAAYIGQVDDWKAPGHAMDCVHDLYIDNVIPSASSNPVFWSVAYSFRAVTVI